MLMSAVEKKNGRRRSEGHPGEWRIVILYRLVIKRFFIKLTFQKVLKKVWEPAMGIPGQESTKYQTKGLEERKHTSYAGRTARGVAWVERTTGES